MKEEDIRKREIFDEYLRLVAEEVKGFFDFDTFLEIRCPSCQSFDNVFEFEKLGFRYVSCKNCLTLFVNPRPPYEILKDYYSKSKAVNYLASHFFKFGEGVRREKIFKPRAKLIYEIISGRNNLTIGDIGAGYGIFLEEIINLLPDNYYVAIEPSHKMAEVCRKKKIKVEHMCFEDIEGKNNTFDLLTAFEVVEHLFEAKTFFETAYSLLKPGGYFFLTTLNNRGFDILLLWENSKNITPPYHLNFFNLPSLKLLLEKIGFEIIETATPGMLDWDIVEGMVKNEKIDLGKFWNFLAFQGTNVCKEELQSWISKNNLSSHMRILAKKPNK